MASPSMYFQPTSTLPASYRLPTGVICEVFDHDLAPVGFRLFLSALTNTLAFSCSRSPSPEVMADYFNRDPGLLTGWYVIRSHDKELTCDISEYDMGTYSRFCLDHKYLYIVWRRHDPTFTLPPPPPSPIDQEVSDEDMQSIDSVRADEENVVSRSPKGKRRVAMRWTATDLENLRAGVAQFGKDWHAILNTYDFRGRNTRALSERWHRLTAIEMTAEEKLDQAVDENLDENSTSRPNLPNSRPRGKRNNRSRRGSAPENVENGDRSHICATQRFYTEKEEQNLREGVARFGQDWPRILAEYWGDNPDRSTKSLAKKWRVLSGLIEADDKGSEINPDEMTQDELKRRRRSGSSSAGDPPLSPSDVPDIDSNNNNVSGSKRTRRSGA